MRRNAKKYSQDLIKGTVDIGAGDRPIKEAIVAVDINIPTKPPKRIKVIKGEGAKPSIGLALKLSKNSKLKVYYAGDATKLPSSFDGKFSKVYSDSAIGSYDRGAGDYGTNISGVNMGRKIGRILKPGGRVEIVANAAGASNPKKQRAVSRKHIDKINKILTAGGLRDITVKGKETVGNFTFVAEKPLSVDFRAKRLTLRPPRISPKLPRITPKPPRITPKTPRIR